MTLISSQTVLGQNTEREHASSCVPLVSNCISGQRALSDCTHVIYYNDLGCKESLFCNISVLLIFENCTVSLLCFSKIILTVQTSTLISSQSVLGQNTGLQLQLCFPERLWETEWIKRDIKHSRSGKRERLWTKYLNRFQYSLNCPLHFLLIILGAIMSPWQQCNELWRLYWNLCTKTFLTVETSWHFFHLKHDLLPQGQQPEARSDWLL